MINKKKIQFFKSFLDEKIPQSKKFKMPKFSNAVDIKNFISEIYKDLKLKKITYQLKIKKNNSKLLAKLEKHSSFLIICSYYSSPIVLKRLARYKISRLKNFNR